MRLVTIDDLPRSRAGLIIGNEVLCAAHGFAFFGMLPWKPANVLEMLEAGESGLIGLRELESRTKEALSDELIRLRQLRGLTPLASTKLRAPIERPRILLSGGAQFPSHQEEMTRLISGDVPRPAQPGGTDRGYATRRRPSAHTKNAGSIIGPDDPIVLPSRAPGMVDWEAEFAVVFGKPCFNASVEEAADAIVGYTFINDLGPRDPAMSSFDAVKAGKPMDFAQIGLAKSMPTMCPLGPCVATKEDVPDPDNLRFWLKVNGVLMQDASTSEMVFTVAQLAAEMSQWYGFEAGDVLSMGSPAGVGLALKPPRFLQDGDVVEIGAEGIGVLRNPVKSVSGPSEPLWTVPQSSVA
ncbi:fumarylacetoacetate hydrolase family protein [Sphingomonas sp.]|uniref:fumarylacetoacetate hydrolase family protein n=1 Tax=Sphingomonas sp. TaxID=28214 RepID=UPI0025E57D71|nr:fumarylacetoacetate hydrolase family protein [Sphingomonas sp.]